jgi:methionyl-tRNA formyltransferase
VAAGHEVALVVTRADKRRRRGGDPEPSPVKAAALELGLPVSEDPDDLVDLGAELGVVVAYGRIIKPHVLAALPMVNIHFSLLPRWRGAAPVERALLAGDEVTGVGLMEVVDELDAGAVYAQAEVPIGPDDTLSTLRAALVDEGTRLLVEALADGLGEPEPQQGEVVYAEKLSPEDLHLDWNRSATELDRVVRVGGAWTTFRGKRLKVHAARPEPVAAPGAPGTLDGVRVATGEGVLELVEVQPEGKGRQPADAWANGARLGPEDRLE